MVDIPASHVCFQGRTAQISNLHNLTCISRLKKTPQGFTASAPLFLSDLGEPPLNLKDFACKLMVGSDDFPFGAQPILMQVSGSGTCFCRSNTGRLGSENITCEPCFESNYRCPSRPLFRMAPQMPLQSALMEFGHTW